MKYLKIFRALISSFSNFQEIFEMFKDGVTKDEIDDIIVNLVEAFNKFMKSEGKPEINAKIALDLTNTIVSGLNSYTIISDYIKQLKTIKK